MTDQPDIVVRLRDASRWPKDCYEAADVIGRLRAIIDHLYDSLGPAADDVMDAAEAAAAGGGG